MMIGIRMYLICSSYLKWQSILQKIVTSVTRLLSSTTKLKTKQENSPVQIVNLINEEDMACASCSAKASNYGARFASAPRSVELPPEECVYAKEEIEVKRDELKVLFQLTHKNKRYTLSLQIFQLNRALRDYDENCNKYLTILNGIL